LGKKLLRQEANRAAAYAAALFASWRNSFLPNVYYVSFCSDLVIVFKKCFSHNEKRTKHRRLSYGTSLFDRRIHRCPSRRRKTPMRYHKDS
jgi:hypothetical protein